MGFFAFLLFFEFIFLLLKKYFNPYTKGEPLKELLVMLVLAGLLIPLHKWVDHQVIRNLTKKRKSVTRGNVKPKVVADSERADIMNRQRTLNPAEAAKYSDNYDVYE
jgi:hypothetical protein